MDVPSERGVSVGFYAHFRPVSWVADPDAHAGYEADLLTAVDHMDVGLRFDRFPITEWPRIWLLPATDRFDLVAGGITILDERRYDRHGDEAVAFTVPHIEFRQSLLVRSDDAGLLDSYDKLHSEDRIGVIGGTTGESRLMEILRRPGRAHPAVVYFDDETELLDALRSGDIDAVARGTIGNAQAAIDSDGRFAVAVVDDLVEHGGFAVDAADVSLLDRMNDAVRWLTDGGRIGIEDWLANPDVFAERAALAP